MISIKEFYNLYNRNSPLNKNRNIGDIDARFFLRDLSLTPAYIFAKLGVKAKCVTLSFLTISIIGDLIYSRLTTITILISLILFEFAQILDCIDGQLARYTGTFSKEGGLMDNIFHEIVISTFILIYGLRLSITHTDYIYLIMSGIGVYSFSFNILWDKEYEKLNIKFLISHRIINKLLNFINPFLKEPRFILLALLMISIIQPYTNYASLYIYYFLILIFSNLLEKIVFRLIVLYKVSDKNKKINWKGW